MKSISEYLEQLHNYTNSIDFKNITPKSGKKYIDFIGSFCEKKMAPAFMINYSNSETKFTRSVSYKGRNGIYKNLEELWAPPKNKVLYPGRVNFKNRSILYCAEHAATALFENKPKSKTRFALVKFSITKPMKLMSFGLKSKYKDYGTHSFTNKEIALDKYFADKFIEEIDDLESYKYLQTAIIANLFYPNEIDGFVYPCAASNFKGENIALKTEFAKKYTDIEEARIVDITNFVNSRKFTTKCKFVAYSTTDNVINWETIECKGHKLSENLYHK